jgi:hypothetical protein
MDPVEGLHAGENLTHLHQQNEEPGNSDQKSLHDTPTRGVLFAPCRVSKKKNPAAAHAASRLDFFTKASPKKSAGGFFHLPKGKTPPALAILPAQQLVLRTHFR